VCARWITLAALLVALDAAQATVTELHQQLTG
jgi:hypothetical protein